MHTWTATATAPAAPEAVLALLTDPDACRRWAPVPFDVEDLCGDRLRAGTRARVSGRLAGRSVGFDVCVHAADPGRMALTATGPVGFDVAYDLEAVDGGTELRASVSVLPGRGLAGRLLTQATAALLSGGALALAVARIADQAAY